MTSIVILVYNQIDYTKKCLESIFRHTKKPFELIIVDNGSTDGTDAYLGALADSKKNDVRIHLIRNKENLGFAAGNNQGIAAALGEYILLLNNDTIVTDGWLELMVACAESHPNAGIVGPMSNCIAPPQLIRNVGYNTQTAAGLNKFAIRFAGKNKGRATQIIRVIGFCMLIKREVVDRIGGLDDCFGKGNFEDDDFCIRAALAGFESWIAEDCFIHHFGSRTFAGAKIDFKAILEKNWEIFKEKWGFPKTLPYGSGYRLDELNSRTFDPAKHYVPLPESAFKRTAPQPKTAETEENRKAPILENNISRILNHAQSQAYKGQVDKALKTLFKGIRISRDDKRLYYSLAEILINEKQYNAALEILGRVPSSAEELKKLQLTGYCKEALGQDDEAEECANKMLALDNNSAPAFYIKGKLTFKKGLIRESEGYLLQAIKANEGFGTAYSCLGLLKKKAGLDNEAQDLLEKGFILAPTNHEVLSHYHKEVGAQRAFERAERIFKDALGSYPKHRLIHFKVIDLLLQQAKFEEAMDEIEKAIVEYGPDDGMIAAALSVRKRLGPKDIKNLSGKKGAVSLCMIVKDEEDNIGKCLLNLKPLADEMIIVDTGSSDRTKALAEIFGAKLYDFEWNNDFSAARNYSLSKATGDWILVMDADEIISPNDFDAIKKIVKAKKPKAFSFVTRNYTNMPNIIGTRPNDGTYKDLEMGCGWTPSGKIRLFKNGLNIRFEYPVHEAVEPFLKHKGIKTDKCPVPIHHYGKLNRTKDLQKGEGYYHLGIKKLEESPRNAKAIFELAVQAGGLKKWEEAIMLWKKYITLSSDNPTAFLNLGTAYLHLGRFVEATESTKRAMEIKPDMNDAVSNYATIQIYHGKAETSIPLLEGLKKNSPHDPAVLFKLAVAYVCTEKKEDALRLIEGLKKTALSPDLILSFRTIAKEFISYRLVQYAASMIETIEMMLIESFPNQSALNKGFEPAVVKETYQDPPVQVPGFNA